MEDVIENGGVLSQPEIRAETRVRYSFQVFEVSADGARYQDLRKRY